MKHKFYKCPGGDACIPRNGICNYCDGGLESCEVCGGAESSLTTECPVAHIPPMIQDYISLDKIDYKDGEWVFVVDDSGSRPNELDIVINILIELAKV